MKLKRNFLSAARFYLAIPCLVLLLCLTASSVFAHDNNELHSLLNVQRKVGQVVSKAMPACVAISDGVGMGSGVIVNESGLVLTAGHVMGSDGRYEIILPSGRTVKAKPLGKNLNVDSGMLQIVEPGPWPFVPLATASKFQPGEWVVSLGHSGGWELGRKPPVRTGRILSRQGDQVVTDAVLIGGDSGGPLFNLNGELIAIHSSIGDSIAENRHVVIDAFQRDWTRLESGDSWGELPELNEPGRTKRPGKIGVTIDREAPDARIKAVKENSPASEIGIREGDVVIEFDNVKIRNGVHLIDVIRRKRRGEVYSMSILRNGKRISFEIQPR